MRVYFILLVVSLLGCNSSTEKITISFVGDILLDRGVRERIDHIGYEQFYAQVAQNIHPTEYLVGNLECPVTDIQQPVTKKYIFRGEPKNLKYLKKKGFTHFNLANNHSYDQTRDGLVDTYNRLIASEIMPMGYGVSHTSACEPVIIEKRNLRVAIFSTVTLPLENWMVLDNQPSICQAKPTELAEKIKVYKQAHPNTKIIVQLHWGVEHIKYPTQYQRKWAHNLIDIGTDIIIGHHPHTIQTIETYRGKTIFYSIGNAIFDQNKVINNKGLQVTLQITEKTIQTHCDTIRTNY